MTLAEEETEMVRYTVTENDESKTNSSSGFYDLYPKWI